MQIKVSKNSSCGAVKEQRYMTPQRPSKYVYAYSLKTFYGICGYGDVLMCYGTKS